jgi:VanZ family protein
MPGQYIPSVSWLEMLSFDKWVHAGIFLILCILLFVVAIKKQQSFGLVMVYFILAVIYGGLLEIMQAKLFSNRSADWQDFVANSVGCFVALLMFKRLRTSFRPGS